MKLKEFIESVRTGRSYQPVVISRLDTYLRSGKRGSYTLNFSLWLSYVIARRLSTLIRRIRQFRYVVNAGKNRVSSTPPPITPWLDQGKRVPYFQHGRRVLIIAELSMSQCRKYRVEQKVDLLKRIGIESAVISWTDALACLDAMQTHLYIIFYRVPAFPAVIKLIAESRRLGCTIYFDIDDLVFDLDEYAKNKNVIDLPPKEKGLLFDGAASYRQMLMQVDHGIASTRVIAKHMRLLCQGSIHIVENCLDEQLIRLSNEAQTVARERKTWVDIGYGSGTKTHDADFAVAAMALQQVMEDCPQVRLLIYGHLNIGNTFTGFNDRIIQVPFLAPDDYYRALARFDISIAPLEPTVFNDAKSNIKFLEASAFGIPSVCSPGLAFLEIIRHGENGFVASTSDEWRTMLTALANNAELRSKMGSAARDSVFERYHPDVVARNQLLPVFEDALFHEKQRHTRRILIVNLLFHPVSFGGATIVTEQLAAELAKQPNQEVMVFSGNWEKDLTPYAVRAYRWRDIPVITMRLPDGGPRDQEYLHPLAGKVFFDILASFVPDIVHFHSIQGMGTAIIDNCIKAEVPYVITLHDAWWLCERQFMIQDNGQYCHQNGVDPAICSSCVNDVAYSYHRYFHLHRILLGAARLFTPSVFQRELYLASGIPQSLLINNKNGVMRPSNFKKNHTTSPLTLAYLGGRAYHKGYFWLKDLMEGISGDNYRLLLVDIESRFGVSGMAQDLWKVKGSLEISAPFEPTEIDAFFANIDVLIFPSQWKESFGLTVREAMIRNIWVISTDCGGPTEDIRPGENGDLLDMDDASGFAQAIQRLVDNPEIARNYRNPYLGEIRTFTEQAEELSGYYEQILSLSEQKKREAA